MSLTLRYVGLDVHKDTIVIAVADVGREAAEEFAVIAHDYPLLLKKLKRLGAPAQLWCCYEAGPTGYGLYRGLREAGIDCQVVAPSLVPTKAGDRVKTDRRDAKKLAHFLRSGDLTPVYVPSEADEALRDLERAREDAKRAERAARHQLSKFLLRHGRHWSKSSWTQAHLAWIAQQTFDHEAQTRVLGDYLKAVGDAAARVASLTLSIGELVERTTLAPLIKALQALRGVELIAATTIAAEPLPSSLSPVVCRITCLPRRCDASSVNLTILQRPIQSSSRLANQLQPHKDRAAVAGRAPNTVRGTLEPPIRRRFAARPPVDRDRPRRIRILLVTNPRISD